MHLQTTRRAIYPYRCGTCDKRRLTRKYERALTRTCHVCNPNSKVNPLQAPLFK